jgi:RNA polymerase sigma-70 factor, ECF subfamily|tara:strand:+ start:50 stop:658 length:609 start_codon:yes stop_codon:yes gene_type:complete
MIKKTYRQMTADYLKTRSPESFAVLYNRIKPGLTSHINKIVGDWEIAEDLAVQSLTKLWTKVELYNPEKAMITTWLYKIGFNAALGYKNERNKTSSLSAMQDFGIEINSTGTFVNDEYVEEDKTFSEMMDEDNYLQMKYDMTVEAIKNLKPMYRDLLVDRMLKGVKYRELATSHKLSLQTVKNRVRRGKALIAEAVNLELAV